METPSSPTMPTSPTPEEPTVEPSRILSRVEIYLGLVRVASPLLLPLSALSAFTAFPKPCALHSDDELLTNAYLYSRD
jgi:hypothetical protein